MVKDALKPPPEGYELFTEGVIKEGDLFWAPASESWKPTKARMGKSAEGYRLPHARKIQPIDRSNHKDWATW